MKPPKVRFIREDYPELSEKFLRNLTSVADYIAQTLGGRLSLVEASGSFVKEVTFTAADTFAAIRFRNDLDREPLGIVILRSWDVTDATPRAVSLANPAWETSKGDIVISDFGGAVSGQKYRVKMLVLGA